MRQNTGTSINSEAFRRMDETPDQNFYSVERLVTHIDEGAIAAVTELYREFFPPGGAILDLMSSWVSHLPPETSYTRVAGLGMNLVELENNPRLTERAVQSLNDDSYLPYGGDEFDAAGICVSVQYLTDPVTVFAELSRVLKPSAPLVVTFSNRCFPTKAVYAWQMLDDSGHVALVENYFQASSGFEQTETREHLPRRGDPLYAVIGRCKKLI